MFREIARFSCWLILIAAAAAFSQIVTTTAHAQTDTVPATEKVSLAGKWAFKTDIYQTGADSEYWQPELDHADWDRIDVPGVWDTYDRYHDYTGDAWYRFTFPTDATWSQQNIRLVFDGVYHDSETWLNGQKLGENNLGWIPFSFEIDDHLSPAGELNVLTIRANNRFARGAVWNWGGIRRPVYLEVAPEARIERIYVTPTPDIEAGTATVAVRTAVTNGRDRNISACVDLHILRDGKTVYTVKANNETKLSPGETLDFNTQIDLPAELVDLWHFNDPNLYTIKATLRVKGKATHMATDRFGIRKVEVKGDALYLNGAPVRLVGFNMVPEDRFDGNALPLSRIKEDVDLLKSMSANFARLSGPVLPKEYVSYLDEVGFLLVEEVGLWGKDRLVDPEHPLPKEWLERLIDDHYNHPSVIAWSVGNEIGDLTKNPKANEYVKTATEHARQLDPTRLAVYISYSADFQENDPAQYSDIVMFNKYNDHAERLEVVRGYQPGKPIFFSEIGERLDSEDPNLSFINPAAMMAGLRKYPYLIGTSYFAFSDYRSNWLDEKASWTTPVSENRSWGVLTAFRAQKRAFKHIQRFYAPIKGLELSHADGTYTVKVEPRETNTFPAYAMNGYRLAWTARNVAGDTVTAGIIDLPDINPGDPASDLSLPVSGQFAELNVHLIDPAGYPVLSTKTDLVVPSAPTILAAHTSVDTIQVVFEPSPTATEHKLIAIAPDGARLESDPTINEFVELGGLSVDTNYQLQLVALNTAGASTPEASSLEASTSPDELPPVIWATYGREDAFHIGFSSHRRDFKYEIRYGLEPGNYPHQHLIETHGATRVPAIEPGQDHYFQLRRLVRGSVDSSWTTEHKVVLRGEAGLQPPSAAFAIPASDGVVVAVDPVPGATGYVVTNTNLNNAGTFTTRLAYSPFITLTSEDLIGATNLSIATIDNDGKVGAAISLPVIAN